MAEQPIKKSDIIENGLFDDAIRQADAFIIKAKEVENQLKFNLSISKDLINVNKIDSSGVLKEQSNLNKSILADLKNIETLKQAQIKTEIARDNALKASLASESAFNKALQNEQKELQNTQKAVKFLTPEYDKLRERYNQQSRALIEMSIKGKEASIVFKGLKQSNDELRASLDKAEQGAGRFQRSVGDYGQVVNQTSQKFNALGNSVNQISRELPAFSVSINTGLLAISNNLPILFDALEKVNNENKVLIDQGKPVQSVFSQLGSAIFSVGSLLSVGVTLLTVYGGAIIKTVIALFDQTKSLYESESAIKAYNEAVERSSKLQDDLQESISNSTLSIALNSKEINKQQENAFKSFDKYSKASLENEKNRRDELIKIAEEILKKGDKDAQISVEKTNVYGKETIKIRNKNNAELIELDVNARRTIDKLQRSYNEEVNNTAQEVFKEKLMDINFRNLVTENLLKQQYQKELELFDSNEKEAKRLKTIADNKKIKDLIDLSDRIKRINAEQIQDTVEREITLLKLEEEISIREVKKINATAKQKQELILSLEIDTNNKLLAIQDKYFNEFTKKQDEEIAKTNDKIKEQVEKTYNARVKVQTENSEFEIYNLEQKYNELKKLNDKNSLDELNSLQLQILEKKKLLIQSNADENKGKTDNEAEKIEIQNRANIEIEKLKLQSNKTIAENNKAFFDKELKDTFTYTSKIIDAIAKAEAEKSKLKQDSIQREITQTDKSIETQRRLAEKGLTNELAQQEAKKAELELAREEERIKEVKRQKVLAFFKLFSSYAEKDPNSALQNALRDTALAEVASASFFEGTESVERDLQGNKRHSGRDGYNINVDGSERILTGEQNKLVGTLSNEELASLAYNYNTGLLDTAPIAVTQKSFSENFMESAMLNQLVGLKSEISDLKDIIKNRPVNSFQFDAYGDFIKTTIEGGFTKVTKMKQNKPRIN